MAKHEYNLIAIGAGAAGLVTSYIAAAVKARVALVERHKMGGDCLNTGCVPSKALIAAAKVAKQMKRAEEFGFRGVRYEVDFARVMESVQEAVAKIEPHDSVERYTSLGVDCVRGEARIRSPHEVVVDGRTLTAANIVVATGARPLLPPVPGLDAVGPLHSDNVWGLRRLPARLLVMGGGAIGCELAQAFARLGSAVTLIDMAPTILPREDPDAVRFVAESLARDGVEVITGAQLTRFEPGAPLHAAVYRRGGAEARVEFDQVLVAVGRKPNTAGFGLEELGVELNPNGTVKVDQYMRTNIPNIYACGDVAGPYQFTHMASHQAWYCAVNALVGVKKFAVDYSVVPWVTYTDPELARVGLIESEARNSGTPHEVTTYDLSDLDRAICEREDRGLVKVLTPPGSDRILGATIAGNHAGELLAEFVLAMKHGIGLNKILGTIHSYPTHAEAVKFAAGNWKKAHAPRSVLELVKKFHDWKR